MPPVTAGMNEQSTIESTIANLRSTEENCHRCDSEAIPDMVYAAREVRSALETFSGHRSSAPVEAGGVPEARSHLIAAREAAEHLLGSAGHDMNVLGNIEAATREMRKGLPA